MSSQRFTLTAVALERGIGVRVHEKAFVAIAAAIWREACKLHEAVPKGVTARPAHIGGIAGGTHKPLTPIMSCRAAFVYAPLGLGV